MPRSRCTTIYKILNNYIYMLLSVTFINFFQVVHYNTKNYQRSFS